MSPTTVIPSVLRLRNGSVIVSTAEVVGARAWENEDGLYLDVLLTRRTVQIPYGKKEHDRQMDMNNIEQVLASRQQP